MGKHITRSHSKVKEPEGVEEALGSASGAGQPLESYAWVKAHEQLDTTIADAFEQCEQRAEFMSTLGKLEQDARKLREDVRDKVEEIKGQMLTEFVQDDGTIVERETVGGEDAHLDVVKAARKEFGKVWEELKGRISAARECAPTKPSRKLMDVAKLRKMWSSSFGCNLKFNVDQHIANRRVKDESLDESDDEEEAESDAPTQEYLPQFTSLKAQERNGNSIYASVMSRISEEFAFIVLERMLTHADVAHETVDRILFRLKGDDEELRKIIDLVSEGKHNQSELLIIDEDFVEFYNILFNDNVSICDISAKAFSALRVAREFRILAEDDEDWEEINSVVERHFAYKKVEIRDERVTLFLSGNPAVYQLSFGCDLFAMDTQPVWSLVISSSTPDDMVTILQHTGNWSGGFQIIPSRLTRFMCKLLVSHKANEVRKSSIADDWMLTSLPAEFRSETAIPVLSRHEQGVLTDEPGFSMIRSASGMSEEAVESCTSFGGAAIKLLHQSFGNSEWIPVVRNAFIEHHLTARAGETVRSSACVGTSRRWIDTSHTTIFKAMSQLKDLETSIAENGGEDFIKEFAEKKRRKHELEVERQIKREKREAANQNKRERASKEKASKKSKSKSSRSSRRKSVWV